MAATLGMKPSLGPLALLALTQMPEPKGTSEMDRRINARALSALQEQSAGLTPYYDPATMTPWLEDYYYGRRLR